MTRQPDRRKGVNLAKKGVEILVSLRYLSINQSLTKPYTRHLKMKLKKYDNKVLL